MRVLFRVSVCLSVCMRALCVNMSSLTTAHLNISVQTSALGHAHDPVVSDVYLEGMWSVMYIWRVSCAHTCARDC